MIDAGIGAYWCRMPVYPAIGLSQVGLTCQGAIPTADLRRELQAGWKVIPPRWTRIGSPWVTCKVLASEGLWLVTGSIFAGWWSIFADFKVPQTDKKTHWQVNLLGIFKGGAGQFSFSPCDFEHLPGGQSIHFYGVCHYIRKIWSPCAATRTSSQNHSVVLRIIQIDITYH